MNRRKKLLQIGTHLRNTMAIHQVPRLEGMKRVQISPDLDWIAEWERAVRDFWRRHRLRKRYAGVDRMRRVPNEEYDELLSRNVVLTEGFACSASNVVIECVLRHTPIVVNPLPAVLEYLGVDYPLYFADPREVPDLLAESRLFEAHEYLRALDKSDLRIEHFAEGLRRALESCDTSTPRPEAAR